MAIAPQSKQSSDELGYTPSLFADADQDAEHNLDTNPVADDASQTEDLIVTRSSTETVARQIDAPAKGETRPPQHIGHGRLVRNKPSWKPGDPFGQAAISLTHDFDWMQMVRMAGLTVFLGALFIWMM